MKDKPSEIDFELVTQKNNNFTERLLNEGVSIAYDEDGDTLIMTIGQPRDAVTEQILDGIYYRIDPATYDISGCVILGFVSDVLANNKIFRILFQNSFNQLREQGNMVSWKGHQAQKMKPLFELSAK